MLMTKRALLATTVAASALLGAQLPALAAPYDWTGFYIGLHAGGATGDINSTNVSDAAGYFTAVDFNHEPDGVLGGAQLGFDLQLSSFVIGLEAAGSGLDFDDTLVGSPATEFESVEMEWTLTAAARLGFAWDNSLLYVRGGYAGGAVKTLHVDTAANPTSGSYQTDETHNGFVVGAGYEHLIGDSVSVGIEYNYLDLGETDHAGLDSTYGNPVIDSVDVQLHTVTARLNWHLFTP